MELTQFQAEMRRLQDRYGKMKYPEVLQDILFAKFKNIEYSAFRKVVAKLIAYEAYAPLFEKFQSELRVELATVRENQIEEIKKRTNCHSCQNTGRLSIEIKKNESPYSFRCHCKLGEEMFPNFPAQPSESNQSSDSSEEKLNAMF